MSIHKLRKYRNSFESVITRIFRFILHFCFLLLRPVTLGARVLVTFEDKNFIMVKHTYNSDWYLPGGGVNAGECSEEAAKRELNEEIGLNVDENLILLSIKHNKVVSRRDHVVFFHVSLQKIPSLNAQRFEIEEIKTFTPEILPERVDPLSLSIIREYYDVRS